MKTLQRSIKASKRERPRHCDSRLLQGASAIAVAAPGSIEWLGTVNGTVGNISKRKPNRTTISNLSLQPSQMTVYIFMFFGYFGMCLVQDVSAGTINSSAQPPWTSSTRDVAAIGSSAKQQAKKTCFGA